MFLEKISFAFFPVDLKFFFLHQLLQYFEFFSKLRWKLVTRLQVLKLVNFKFLPSVGLLHPAFIQFQFAVLQSEGGGLLLHLVLSSLGRTRETSKTFQRYRCGQFDSLSCHLVKSR